jgi:hypothetical protein
MKKFQEFMSLCEATYDPDLRGSSQITGPAVPGGRLGALRVKTNPETSRVKAIGGGETAPAKRYKDRSDIGNQRGSQSQAPTQQRGSTEVKARAAAAEKAERKKAAQARIAARQGKASAPTTDKPRGRESEKAATKLLSKNKPKPAPAPGYKQHKASGYTDAERQKVSKHGERELRNIMKQQEIDKYKKSTGEAPKGKAKTKVLAYVQKRMSN